jgi:probable H4MPT-linked C1 transfer pathway protein
MGLILGLDIGGANTKASSSNGRFVESIYLPLWRGADLKGELRALATRAKPCKVAVVMTGELADCFEDKLSGIKSISQAVRDAFDVPVRFWGISGFDPSDPIELAAANYSASAAEVASEFGDCLFVDMGSTTTDLIPIKGGRSVASSTDFKRLSRGELLYTGMLRTSVGSLLPTVQIGELRVSLSPEFFAVAADARMALGDIVESEYTCDSPDGAPKDRAHSLQRLARTVCADLEEIGEEGAIAIAEQVKQRQLSMLMMAIEEQARRRDVHFVVAAGIGEDFIALAAINLRLRCVRLSERYGKQVSAVFPAYAVARLLERAEAGS